MDLDIVNSYEDLGRVEGVSSLFEEEDRSLSSTPKAYEDLLLQSSIGEKKSSASSFSLSETPFQRPSLPSPMWDILELQKTEEDLTQENARQITSRMEEGLNKIKSLNEEQMEYLEKETAHVAETSTWEILQNAATYISSSLSLVTGLASLYSGFSWGVVFLTFSGALGLSNQLATDLDLWDSLCSYFTSTVEEQEELVKSLQEKLYFLSLGSGLLGLYLDAKDVSKHLSSATFVATTIFSAGTALGKGMAEQKVYEVREKMVKNRQALFEEKNKIQDLSEQSNETFQNQQSINGHIQSAIEGSQI